MRPVKAARYVVSMPPRGEDEGYTFWADEDGFVLESYEGLDLSRPWMTLMELQRGTVSGAAHITGRHEFVIDPRDALGRGFLVGEG